MDLMLLGIVIILFVIIIVMFLYLYNVVAINSRFVFELSDLVARTFREYYSNENLEPVVINNGVDIVWKGITQGFKEDNKLGFITILTNDANVNSPINDIKEADVLAAKIIYVVNEYVRERDGQLRD